MDVAKSDPNNAEARSPQAGRSGFLNSQAPLPGAGKAERAGNPLPPRADSGGLASPLSLKSLGAFFARLGLPLSPETLVLARDRAAAALSFLAARGAGAPPQAEMKPAVAQERAAAVYRRAKGLPAEGQGGRARSLALLAGLFQSQGLDLDAQGLASLSMDLEGGASGGSGGGLDGDASGQTDAEPRGNADSGLSGGGGGEGGTGLRAEAVDQEAEEAELALLERAVKAFFSSRGDGPNDWQAFNQAAAGRDPSWRLLPFAFSAGDVDFSGFFRVLFRKSDRAVLSLGADFRSNGHDYSFTLRGTELALEVPEPLRAEGADALAGLARAVEGRGMRLSYSGFGSEGGEGAGRNGGAWA